MRKWDFDRLVELLMTFAYKGVAYLLGVVTFFACWAYAIDRFGWLVGGGLGWIPAVIVAWLAGALWPLWVAAMVYLVYFDQINRKAADAAVGFGGFLLVVGGAWGALKLYETWESRWSSWTLRARVSACVGLAFAMANLVAISVSMTERENWLAMSSILLALLVVLVASIWLHRKIERQRAERTSGS